jgi:hypothetical protein
MIENSKEGTPEKQQYTNHGIGERGYYYSLAEAKPTGSGGGACPDGWALPDSIQLQSLWSYLGGISGVNAENKPWVTDLAGYMDGNTGRYWDETGFWRDNRGNHWRYYKSTNVWNFGSNLTAQLGVRCIKTTCDEAPYATSLTHLSPIAAQGGQDTIIVSAVRSVGPVTYSWSVPTGLTILNATPSDTLVVEYTTVGSYHWGDLKCAIQNACGTTTVTGIAAGDFSIIAETGSEGQGVVGNSGTKYRTYQFPGELGTWIIDPMQEEEYTCSAPKQTGSGNWYYYDYAATRTACPDGWELPNFSQAWDAVNFARTLPPGNAAHDAWWTSANTPGQFLGSLPSLRINQLGLRWYMPTAAGRIVWYIGENLNMYREYFYQDRIMVVCCVASSLH